MGMGEAARKLSGGDPDRCNSGRTRPVRGQALASWGMELRCRRETLVEALCNNLAALLGGEVARGGRGCVHNVEEARD